MTVPTTSLEEKIVYQHPASLREVPTHYCPGCTHGISQRLVAEVLDELGVRERTIGVSPVGCAVLAYSYFNFDGAVAAHGRAPAMATGIKRVMPEHVVFTYQGDGDLVSIGMAEIVHAAARGENITTVFINNAIYGMTGGQMAPTTLPDQVTKSSPDGRDVSMTGLPLRMSELLAGIDGAAYIVRRSLHNVKQIIRAKKALRIAFKAQLAGLGFSMVELLSTCPTNWGLSAPDAMTWVEHNMVPYYSLGDYKISDDVRSLLRRK